MYSRCLSVLLLLFSVNSNALVIDTYSSWNGLGSIGYFGEGSYSGELSMQTYGQTFTVSEDAVLSDFAFYLNDHLNTDYVDFEAYVMAWDGNKADGPILFKSATMSTTNNNGLDGFERLLVQTDLSLVSGSYVAFFTSSNVLDSQNGTGLMAYGENIYGGGNFFTSRNGSDFSLLTTQNWYATFGDAAFVMNFSNELPEPSPIFLMALSLFLARRLKNA